MRRPAAWAIALPAGLVLAWIVTIVAAEILRTALRPDESTWPAWFPTTPIVLATLLLWFLFARLIVRRFGGS